MCWGQLVSMLTSVERITFTFKVFRVFFPERLTVIITYTDGGGCHARCQPAHQEQFGVQYLAQAHSTCRPGVSNQQPSANKTLAPPLGHCCPTQYMGIFNTVVSSHSVDNIKSFFACLKVTYKHIALQPLPLPLPFPRPQGTSKLD